jgi:hypothetical protein
VRISEAVGRICQYHQGGVVDVSLSSRRRREERAGRGGIYKNRSRKVNSIGRKIDVFLRFPLSPTLSPLVPRRERGFALV